jgi:MFS family permease
MAALIPGIVLGPFVGPLIDRWNRKKIMIFADLAISLLTVVLVILFFTKTIQVWHIYAIMVGRAIGGTFQNPALGASIPMIVPEKQLVRANRRRFSHGYAPDAGSAFRRYHHGNHRDCLFNPAGNTAAAAHYAGG